MTSDNLAALLTAFLALPALGQPAAEPTVPSGPVETDSAPLTRGLFEFSTAASYASLSYEDDGYRGDEALNVLNVPLRLGYMVTPSFEVEAEGLITHASYGGSSNTGYQIGGQLLYHFGQKDVVPFLLAGAGVGDSVDLYNAAYGGFEDDAVTSLRAGAGLKAFVGSQAAFRIEYRFAHYLAGEVPQGYEPNRGANQHRLFTGISLFLH